MLKKDHSKQKNKKRKKKKDNSRDLLTLYSVYPETWPSPLICNSIIIHQNCC